MLNYNEFGTGPTLLIAHGLYGSARNWGVIAKRLSDTRRVVVVDMRNHGDSPRFDTHSYPDMANDLAAVIEHISTPVDLLGHSMGGKASMALALTRPELVRSLISADIAPVSYSHSQIHFIEAMRAVDLNSVTRRAEANEQLEAQGVSAELQSFLTQSLDIPNKVWRLNFDALAADMSKILSFPKLAGAYDGPTLFLSGSESNYVTREHRSIIKPLFPNARFAKIPETGHWLHSERPRAFESAVRTYLDAVSKQS